MKVNFYLCEASIYKKLDTGNYVDLTDVDFEFEYDLQNIPIRTDFKERYNSEYLLVLHANTPDELVIPTTLETLLGIRTATGRGLGNIPAEIYGFVVVKILYSNYRVLSKNKLCYDTDTQKVTVCTKKTAKFDCAEDVDENDEVI